MDGLETLVWRDITRTLSPDLPAYTDEERFSLRRTQLIERDDYNLSLLSMGAHCGTHMDAPAHFLPGGVPIECVPLEILVGNAAVIEITDRSLLEDLPDTPRLLLRSRDFSGLTPGQAQRIVRAGVRLLGTDRLSVAPPDDEARIHRLLLSQGVWLLENLALEDVPDGAYQLCALPLKIADCEGAPARALLGRTRW